MDEIIISFIDGLVSFSEMQSYQEEEVLHMLEICIKDLAKGIEYTKDKINVIKLGGYDE